MLELNAKKRDLKVSAGDLRESNQIPAIYYGAGKASCAISVDARDFDKIFKLSGETSTIDLNIEGEGKLTTLVHSVDKDPVKNNPIHIDFLVVDINKPIEVSIPIEFIGEAPAVKGGLGTLVKVMHEIAIKALPKDIPHNIDVDISVLTDIESQIKASDLVLPTNVELVADADEIVASIAVQKEEKEEVPVDLSAIEVEKKGKKEEEGGEVSEEK